MIRQGEKVVTGIQKQSGYVWRRINGKTSQYTN